jgi:hypothetical protein
MKTMIRLATAQARDRRQFGRPIADFGLVREKIAQMTVDCFAAESTVWMVAHYIDQGYEDDSTEAAISKVFASEAMQRAAHEALQIAGGNGFMRDFPYERATRDSRILSIFEGTNEILRLYIALKGLKDIGKSLNELKSAVSDIFNHPIKGLGVLSGYAERRLARATGHRRRPNRGPVASAPAQGCGGLRALHAPARRGLGGSAAPPRQGGDGATVCAKAHRRPCGRPVRRIVRAVAGARDRGFRPSLGRRRDHDRGGLHSAGAAAHDPEHPQHEA